MKTHIPSEDDVKGKATAGIKTAKTAVRKAKSKIKRNVNSLKRSSKDMEGSFGGYSRQAQDFFDRSKTALSAANDWATTNAKHIPAAARKLNIPNQNEMMDFAEQRPLVVGAVGLGLGLFLGTLLPRIRSAPPASSARRRK